MTRVRLRPASSLRLFQNRWLEQLTFVSAATFGAVWATVLGIAVVASYGIVPALPTAGLMLAGVLGWTLFEYALHRFIFHMQVTSAGGRWLMFLIHGNHHAAPTDPHRNLMPPAVSVPIALTVWSLLVLALGPKGSPVFLGFAVGYVVYDWLHYTCHQRPMQGTILHRWQRHHLRHHYGQEEGNYAVTAIAWDRLLGTDLTDKR